MQHKNKTKRSRPSQTSTCCSNLSRVRQIVSAGPCSGILMTAPSPKNQAAFFSWAPKDLNQKVEAWQAYTSGMDKQSVLKIDLKQYWAPTQVSWLWARLNRKELPAAKPEVKSVWQNKEVMKKPEKNKLLRLNLGCPHDWQQHYVEMSLEISSSKEKGERKDWVTRGELEVMKGWEEADRHIREGKYEEGHDSEGEVVYKKKRKYEANSEKEKTTVKVTKSRRLNADQMADVASMLQGRFAEGSGLSTFGFPDSSVEPISKIQVLRRPAGAKSAQPEDGEPENALAKPKGKAKTGTSPEKALKMEVHATAQRMASSSMDIMGRVHALKGTKAAGSIKGLLQNLAANMRKHDAVMRKQSTCDERKVDKKAAKSAMTIASRHITQAQQLIKQSNAFVA